jgi:hypothetical protein
VAPLLPQLHFTPDAQEKDLEIFHRLKLYADDDPTGQSRKPVVHVSGCSSSRTRGCLQDCRSCLEKLQEKWSIHLFQPRQLAL